MNARYVFQMVAGFLLALLAFAVMVFYAFSGESRHHERPADSIVLAPSEESSAAEEVVTEFNVAVTRNAWEATERALSQMGLKDSVSLKDATYAVCKRNGIAVAEWGLDGKIDSHRLPAGFKLTVSVDEIYALADAVSSGSGSGDAIASLTVPYQINAVPLLS